MDSAETLTALRFVKMHGTGNHFVLIDGRQGPERDWSELAEALCQARYGVGADGLLVVLPSDRGVARMRMFNADGSEDMCGNGLRCVVRYLAGRGEMPAGHGIVEALSGSREVAIVEREDQSWYRVELGEPSLAAADIPSLLPVDPAIDYALQVDGRPVRVTLVSMGTPHAVVLNQMPPDDEEWRHLSCRIERHPAFPDRITATWAEVESSGSLRARFFERGVGPTLACGTGACAAVVAAALQGSCERSARVNMPGGSVDVEWRADGHVVLTGPAVTVFEGEWPRVPCIR